MGEPKKPMYFFAIGITKSEMEDFRKKHKENASEYADFNITIDGKQHKFNVEDLEKLTKK